VPQPSIDRIIPPASDDDLTGLAHLLVAVVEAGGSVSFLAPFTLEQAKAWWSATLTAARSRAVFLVARDEQGIVGTVQLQPAWAPNQPHHAEIAKLLVHPRARRMGLGTRLMEAIETEARQAGFRLLTLDTRRGGAAEQMYSQLGWTTAGIIPRFALDPDGSGLHDTVIFYKELG
jgi:GNAT superfamily N-acetyltransferase